MSSAILAKQYLQQGKYKQAEQVYRQLIEINKQDVNAIWGLGEVAYYLNSFKQAYNLFVRCLSIEPNQPTVYLSLANACIRLQKLDKAEQALKFAYQINTKSINTLIALAVFYCEQNQLDESQKYIEQLQVAEPLNIRAFALLVRMGRLCLGNKKDQTYLGSMLAKLTSKKSEISCENKALLLYGFAELNHKAKQYQQAFSYFYDANKLQRQQINFSVKDMQPYFNSLLSTFNKPLLDNSLATDVQPTLTPIFILGQPRSGSTLLEQMLLGNPLIASAGEMSLMAGSIADGIVGLTGEHFPHGCAKLTSQHRHKLAQYYLNQLQTIAPSSNYIIDKMPSNYQSIGLIKMLMPHAKVIHISRDHLDVNWSIFRNNFAEPEPYFCSLAEITEYQESYQKVMQHWNNLIPEFVYNVRYEELVENPQIELEKLFNFLNLELHAECMSFEGSSRYIGTLSDIQLRQGLQSKFQRQWQPYKQYLKPYWPELA
ncbi:tetratricopeptide repeat-containing sulfotransferase family protein [Thalassomonas sp. M1454]|uniref:tetratricopeptide repeat-containing sulfotransferase family protein n=1 Tax=Thalassomonas sp. M1454 TaxID=2594477 RepID=UPI00118138D0|nr:sulfotransferase [Thalassomonas sp. M1454]TRX53998.1 tetratricopeptide repeat protein [Thalassomonas sp. M1454]